MTLRAWLRGVSLGLTIGCVSLLGAQSAPSPASGHRPLLLVGGKARKST